MYITHPTHGAGARPGKTQPPTATRKTTLNADQCVRQPRQGRGRNRQTPPQKKTVGEGGARTAHSHQTAHQHRKRRPNPPQRRHRRQDPSKGHRGTTQPKPATPSREQRPTGKRDTQNTQTHTTLGREKKTNNAAQKRGDGGTETTRPKTGTASIRHHKAKTRQPPPKKNKKRQHPHIPAPQAAPKEGRGQAGHTHDRTHTPTTETKKHGAQPKPEPSTHADTAHPSVERRGTSGPRTQTHTRPNTPARTGGARHQLRPNHTPPQSTPNQEVQKTTRDGHTSTQTPQHLPKEWQGAAETQTPARTPTPHTRTWNGGLQAERAHNHARPKTLTKKGGVQAETQVQPQTPQTPVGKRGTTPQAVPKHTHPRPQPGLAGLPKPTPKHNPDPITNATQQ